MTPPRHCVVVGPGRMGSAIVAALRAAGVDVTGPLGRGERCPPRTDCVLLCVPDAEIGNAAHAVPPGPLVGHVSGATTLAPLAPHAAFSMHPLMTVPATFEGAGAAIAGSTDRALATARALAEALGMQPFEIADDDRAAYHAAASMASNYLVALEDAAERLLATAGAGRAGRDLLVPLVRATVDNWARGGAAALTGPIARGDEETVARQREAVTERTPELLALFDALTDSTRELVR
jgi:predicted short-subunit dehydrogenase-like oxidoreductase (DUF2520 family)